MGESFLGFPNRFNVIGSLAYNPNDSDSRLDTALSRENIFNPNRPLSAFYGYRLSTEYLNRSGGKDFNMTGNFYTEDVIPNKNDINTLGSETCKYHSVYTTNIYATDIEGDSFSGNAASASKLKTERLIEVTLKQNTNSDAHSGSAFFDGTKRINIEVMAPYLHLLDGGTVRGAVTFNPNETPLTIKRTMTTQTILPGNDSNNAYNIGGEDDKYSSVYADTFHGALDGNASTATHATNAGSADTATKLTTARNIFVALGTSSTAPIGYSPNGCAFNGSSDAKIYVKVPDLSGLYLPLTGGTVTGSMTVNNILYLKNELSMVGNKIYGDGTSDALALSTNYIYTGGAVDPTPKYLKVSGPQYGTAGYCIHFYSDDIACNRIVPSIVAKAGQASYLELCHWETTTNANDMNDCVYISAINVGNNDGEYTRKISSTKSHTRGNGVIKAQKFVNTSDIRLKENIVKIDVCKSINIISKSIPVEYNYTNRRIKTWGFIAQQIKHDIKDVDGTSMTTTHKFASEPSSMSLDYIQWTPHITNVLRYLLAKVDQLEVNSGIKDSLEFPDLQKENTFDEAYYREHAEEIAMA